MTGGSGGGSFFVEYSRDGKVWCRELTLDGSLVYRSLQSAHQARATLISAGLRARIRMCAR